MTAAATLWPEAPRWRVSAAWLRRQHDCTLAGILGRCGAACCTSGFWPPAAYHAGEPGPCGMLGPRGCTFAPADKPVTCHLYPLRVRNGLLGLHHRATYERGVCKGNHGRGPMLIDALRANLTELFGEEQYERVRAELLAGHDSYFEVPPQVLAAYEREEQWASALTPPRPRSQAV